MYKLLTGSNSTEMRSLLARDDQAPLVEEDEVGRAEDAETSSQERSRVNVRTH